MKIFFGVLAAVQLGVAGACSLAIMFGFGAESAETVRDIALSGWVFYGLAILHAIRDRVRL